MNKDESRWISFVLCVLVLSEKSVNDATAESVTVMSLRSEVVSECICDGR